MGNIERLHLQPPPPEVEERLVVVKTVSSGIPTFTSKLPTCALRRATNMLLCRREAATRVLPLPHPTAMLPEPPIPIPTAIQAPASTRACVAASKFSRVPTVSVQATASRPIPVLMGGNRFLPCLRRYKNQRARARATQLKRTRTPGMVRPPTVTLTEAPVATHMAVVTVACMEVLVQVLVQVLMTFATRLHMKVAGIV